MAAFEPGTSVYVSYDVVGPAGDVMHERIVLAWVDAAEYVVVTPTYDVFTEELDVANLDLSSVRVGGVGGRLPVGVEAGATYRFDPPLTQAEHGDLLAEGSRMARAERVGRGLAGFAPGPGMLPAAGAVAPVAVPVPPPAVAVAVPGVPAVDPPPRLAGAGGARPLQRPCCGCRCGCDNVLGRLGDTPRGGGVSRVCFARVGCAWCGVGWCHMYRNYLVTGFDDEGPTRPEGDGGGGGAVGGGGAPDEVAVPVVSVDAAIDKERRKAREPAGPAAGGKPPDGKKK